MKTLNDFFEKIYCINLDRRKDRWEECIEEFKKHNLFVERFDAFDGNTLDPLPNLNAGQVGAIYSHRGVIERAKKKELESVLILEDDVEFDDDVNIKFSEIFERIPDNWDIILFGGNHAANNPWSKGELIEIDKNVFKITYSLALHCYAVKNTIYDKVINTLSKMNDTNDSLFAQIQKDVNCYITRPHLAWQRPSYSDLCQLYSDHLVLKDDKALFEGRFFGPEALKRDDIYDKLDLVWKEFWNNQKRQEIKNKGE